MKIYGMEHKEIHVIGHHEVAIVINAMKKNQVEDGAVMYGEGAWGEWATLFQMAKSEKASLRGHRSSKLKAPGFQPIAD